MARIKVQASDIIELTTEIAQYMYDILPDFPEEERWHSASKIRMAAMDLLFFASLGAGGEGAAASEHEWRYAAKNVSALKTIYRFAGRQGFVKIDPDMMLKLDEAGEIIQKELKKTQRSAAEDERKELEPWLKKYKIWKEMQSEDKNS